MKEISAKWVGVMIGSAAVAAFVIGLLVAGALNIFPRAEAREADTLDLLGSGESPFAAVVAQVLPAVVNISSSKRVSVQGFPFDDPFFREFAEEFFGELPRKQTRYSLGSGVIFRSDGYILTNDHVVAEAEDITITLEDGRSFKGKDVKLVGRDPHTDVAVLKVQTKKDLPVVKLGDSDSIRVGDWAIAIGNPFGLEGTVTVGVISAKGRSNLILPSQQRYQNFIQTDAAINPGNSGGPLCNINGEVIGLNTVITSPSGTNIGIGFAVPINMAKEVAKQLIEKGKVERGYLGVYPQELDADMRKSLGLKEKYGILIADVIPGTPAEKAGLRSGDVMLAFDGHKVGDVEEFRERVAATPPGKTIEMNVWRDGKETVLKARLEEFPEESLVTSRQAPQAQRAPFGLFVRSLSATEREHYGISTGVLVEDVESRSPAERSGIVPGDVILKLDGRTVKDSETFRQIVEELKSSPKEVVLVQVYRQGRRFFLTLYLD
jgi:Do/DeqQ family serine protease